MVIFSKLKQNGNYLTFQLGTLYMIHISVAIE